MIDSLPLVMIAGVIAIAATHIRQTCLRLQVQPLVGFVLVGLAIGLTLFAAALIGKLAGAGLPAMLMLDGRRGWLIGVSMVPRAEIAMIIMLQGARMGADHVPPEVLGAMSLVVVATALLVPLWLGRLMPATGAPQRSPDRTDKLAP